MLSTKDLEQLAQKGITELQFETQIENFEKGFPYANLAGAATVGDGIVHFSDADMQEYARLFEAKSDELSMVKFVPASGAASRMFKDLIDVELNYAQSEKKTGLLLTLNTTSLVTLKSLVE